jgi:N-acetylneuraminic acid mutarotase
LISDLDYCYSALLSLFLASFLMGEKMKTNLRILFTILFLALFLIIPSKAQIYQANQWCGNFPDIPGNGPIFGHASVVLGDTIYVAGGSSNGTPSVMVYKYSISGNVWSIGSSLPGPKSGGDLVAARGKVYYIGGGNLSMMTASYEQYVYNPVNGTWLTIANIPLPVSGNVAEAYNDNLIYCMLGGWSSYETLIQVYNINTNSWSLATQIPSGNGRRSFAGGIMGNKLYICAGYDGSYRNDFWVGTINTANPMQISWQQKTNLAVHTSRPGGTAINGRFYVIIGELQNGSGSDSIAVWNTTTESWFYVDGKPTRTNNLFGSTSASIVYCNGRPGVKVWAVGGSLQSQTNRPLEVFADTCLTGCHVITGISGNTNTPERFRLKQNYPNPFNPETEIKFDIPVKSPVNISVYDLTGREVTVLINEIKEPGNYTVVFDGSNYASGIYFYTMKTNGGYSYTYKMVLLK